MESGDLDTDEAHFAEPSEHSFEVFRRLIAN
jgi:hypothetical protein